MAHLFVERGEATGGGARWNKRAKPCPEAGSHLRRAARVAKALDYKHLGGRKPDLFGAEQ